MIIVLAEKLRSFDSVLTYQDNQVYTHTYYTVCTVHTHYTIYTVHMIIVLLLIMIDYLEKIRTEMLYFERKEEKYYYPVLN